MKLQLPAPSPDALAASSKLQALIAQDIQQQSGWIPFARFMELALYAPGLGYYSGGAIKIGKDGDFTTAPEITPLFGQTLAHAVAPWLQQTSFEILEFGAGTGKLALDILTELQNLGIRLEHYSIVDLSGELRGRQQATLKSFDQVRWLDALPQAFSGVIIGNEVLDAMPVHLLLKTDEGWRERGVSMEGNAFAFSDRAANPGLLAQVPEPDTLPIGYLTEVHPAARGFMKSLAEIICAGHRQSGRGSAALLIDYGFPAHEYYLPQRSQGTLMCHYRHHSHPDPFYFPGLQDVTAHVDFSAMARDAIENGMDTLAYMNQAAFLISAGLGNLLLRTAPSDAATYLPQANAVQKLTSPAEMGELFKALIFGKGIDLPDEFLQHDRSHRL